MVYVIASLSLRWWIMRFSLIAVSVLVLSLGCPMRTAFRQEDLSIKMPRFDPPTGTTIVDGPILQALRIAADDFLPAACNPQACTDTLPAYRYIAFRRGDIIFVRIEGNPSYCGEQHSLDAGARYAISTDGRILRRLLDGEADDSDFEDNEPPLPTAAVPLDGGSELIDVTVPSGARSPWLVDADAGTVTPAAEADGGALIEPGSDAGDLSPNPNSPLEDGGV